MRTVIATILIIVCLIVLSGLTFAFIQQRNEVMFATFLILDKNIKFQSLKIEKLEKKILEYENNYR